MTRPDPAFPAPIRLGGATRWPLSGVLRYEAACRGETAPEISALDERYLTAKMVAARLATSERTVWRWGHEAEREREAGAA
jgi:predicted DNA-binding transcriptional regulator AlpA